MEWPEAPFWDYSLALYGRPGIERACLDLQDRHGLDVNLLLLACWLAGRGVAFEPAAARRVRAALRDWQTEVVQPLRVVRRRLRRAPDKVAEGYADLVERLRRRLLGLEIDAEHIEQLALADAVARLPPGAAPGLELAAGNLAACGPFGEADRAALDTLLAAAVPEAGAEARARALSRRLCAAADRH